MGWRWDVFTLLERFFSTPLQFFVAASPASSSARLVVLWEMCHDFVWPFGLLLPRVFASMRSHAASEAMGEGRPQLHDARGRLRAPTLGIAQRRRREASVVVRAPHPSSFTFLGTLTLGMALTPRACYMLLGPPSQAQRSPCRELLPPRPLSSGLLGRGSGAAPASGPPPPILRQAGATGRPGDRRCIRTAWDTGREGGASTGEGIRWA